MFKKNIKPILMAGALALATAVSPVLAETVDGVKVISTNNSFTFTKNYTFADWYDVTKIPHEFSYSITTNDDVNSPLFTMENIEFKGTESDTDGSTTNATTTLSKTGTARVDINKNQLNQTANIIPGEYIYTIKEDILGSDGVTYDSKEYCATVYVQNIKDKDTEGKELETTHVGVAAITLREIIKETTETSEFGDKLDSLTFNNSFLETDKTALSVEKVVTGNYGDKTKYFHFTGTVTIPTTADASCLHEITVTQFDKDKNDYVQKTQTLGIGTNSLDFYLKSEESLDFGTLPVGTKYSFTEEKAGQDGYKTTISGADSAEKTNATPNDAATGTVTKETNDADAVVFTNTKTGSPVTGVIVNNMPYIALLGASGAGLVVLAASKKRSKK